MENKPINNLDEESDLLLNQIDSKLREKVSNQEVATVPKSNVTSSADFLTDNTSYWVAFKRIFEIGMPQAVVFVLTLLSHSISLSMISHKTGNAKVLNGIGLADVYLNYFLTPICYGFVSGYEILAASAFGAEKYKLTGYYAHRALIITYSITIPFIIISFFAAHPIMGLVIKDDETRGYAGQYIQYSVFYTLFSPFTHLASDFLSFCGKPHINYIVSAIVLVVHIFFAWLFIFQLNWGVSGAGATIVISQFIDAMCNYVYIVHMKPVPEVLVPFNKNSVKGLWNYFIFTLPLFFQNLSYSWIGQIPYLFMSYMSPNEFSAFVITENLNGYLGALAGAVITSTTILISKKMGQGLIRSVKQLIIACLIFSFVLVLCANLILVPFREFFVKIFTTDPNVIELGKSYCLIAFLSFFVLAMNGTLNGTYSGFSKQTISIIVSLVVNYPLTIGTCFLFVLYFKMGGIGFFLGSALCQIVELIVLGAIMFTFDYEMLRMQTLSRINRDQRGLNEDEDKDIEKALEESVSESGSVVSGSKKGEKKEKSEEKTKSEE